MSSTAASPKTHPRKDRPLVLPVEMQHNQPLESRMRAIMESIDEAGLKDLPRGYRAKKIVHLCREIDPGVSVGEVEKGIPTEELIKQLKCLSRLVFEPPAIWTIVAFAQELADRCYGKS
jgi:hypothetical protein